MNDCIHHISSLSRALSLSHTHTYSWKQRLWMCRKKQIIVELRGELCAIRKALTEPGSSQIPEEG
jgi:hypothetical protein